MNEPCQIQELRQRAAKGDGAASFNWADLRQEDELVNAVRWFRSAEEGWI